jgi:hypothetical protein
MHMDGKRVGRSTMMLFFLVGRIYSGRSIGKYSVRLCGVSGHDNSRSKDKTTEE